MKVNKRDRSFERGGGSGTSSQQDSSHSRRRAPGENFLSPAKETHSENLQ
jgi:hypothetical protein